MRSICLLLSAGVLFAQPDARPTFEAAFIKANTTGSGSSSTNGTKGQIVMVNQSLKRIIERAYNVKSFQVTGPDWIENVHFDITAKYPEDTRNSDRPAMLRTLLEERFKLVTHKETREMPGYALVAAKNGLKVKPVESPGGDGTSSNEHNGAVTLKVTNIAMAGLADYLARRVDAIVVDHTGAEGHYTFELHWNVDDESGGAAARGAAEFAAVQEAVGTLGLHLQATKLPVDIVVVDHVERVPTGN